MPVGFRYDLWCVPMNTVTDCIWYGKDKEWQEFYADKFQELFRSQGISEFKDQFNLDGTEPEFVLETEGYRKQSCGMPNLSHIAKVTSRSLL
ncbi:hypothetical protein [Labilibaculum sp.]|uniref:hypothetical protein n=1 Tax=Labilibaculum sp. TaxID=2060723 RepID=UPI002AA7DA47|nr:hypothetical protein [Labilibaculum sp.]